MTEHTEYIDKLTLHMHRPGSIDNAGRVWCRCPHYAAQVWPCDVYLAAAVRLYATHRCES